MAGGVASRGVPPTRLRAARYAPAAELPRTSRGKSEREDPRVAHPKKTLGKKFNSRKEDVVGDTYLGIRKYRFYIKCCVCSNEIAFKTDPQNQDYVCESGATRNFESWRQQDDKEKEFEDEQKESNEQNAMAALESRTLDSKIEMDILDALDEIKAYNERHERVDRAESYLAEPTTGAPPARCSRTHLLGLHTQAHDLASSSAASITETRRPSRSRKSWARA